VCDILDEREDAIRGEPGRRGAKRVGIAVDEDDAMSGRGERLRGREADAARGAGDESGASQEGAR
jgi:hypothetical protein